MTSTQFSILFLAVRDSVRAGQTSLMDGQSALEALCDSMSMDYDYWFQKLIEGK